MNSKDWEKTQQKMNDKSILILNDVIQHCFKNAFYFRNYIIQVIVLNSNFYWPTKYRKNNQINDIDESPCNFDQNIFDKFRGMIIL